MRGWRVTALVLPLLWLGGFLAVLALSSDPHSWVYGVWGEPHPVWDSLTAVAGIASAMVEGNALFNGWLD